MMIQMDKNKKQRHRAFKTIREAKEEEKAERTWYMAGYTEEAVYKEATTPKRLCGSQSRGIRRPSGRISLMASVDGQSLRWNKT